MTRHEARQAKPRKDRNVCVFSAKYNPRAPDIRKIFKKHSSILDSDEQAKKVLTLSLPIPRETGDKNPYARTCHP